MSYRYMNRPPMPPPMPPPPPRDRERYGKYNKYTLAKIPAKLPDGLFDEFPWKAPKVSVRIMDFEHFKNRYGIHDEYHIIEVLRATPHLADEIQDEKKRRQDRDNSYKPRSSGMEDTMPSGIQWIQRVRIQSPMILGHFNHVAGNPGWDIEKPRVFFWPFGALRHYYPDMKQQLNSLEERWGEDTPLETFECFEDAPAAQKNLQIDDISTEQKNEENGRKSHSEDFATEKKAEGQSDVYGSDSISGASFQIRAFRKDSEYSDSMRSWKKESDIDINFQKFDNPTALRHLRCYIQFMEQIILPLEKATKDNFIKSGRIKSNDLWHLFQIGDVICAPSRLSSQQQATFVIYKKMMPAVMDNNPDDLSNRGLIIWCYYVDNDGDRYGKIGQSFTIDGYEGERDITDLPLYPLSYAHDYEQHHIELQRHGEHFMAMTKEKHVYCQGWTIQSNPGGPTMPQEMVNPHYSRPEHVDSDVIIDIKEALNQDPGWKFTFGLKRAILEDYSRRTADDDSWQTGDDTMEIGHWSDEQRTRLFMSIEEKTQRSEDIGMAMWRRWKKNTYPAGPLDIENEKGKIIRSAILVMPRRFFAYILRDRKFTSVDVMTMEKIPPQENIFDDLEIDPSNKRMVKSLVASHFQKRELQKVRPGLGTMNQDLIRGKGSGLFILLHGVPGVGKTATAEAVAQANGKPLFAITCGDLGFTPKEVEEELKSIFRLANLWDCVLLLDEADVFLARRDSWNLKRNALVSVFLRVLEYYSGILFLTTNRVGTMDEAFKSRIHITLYYEPLTRYQTEKIFKVNIEKLRRIELEKEKKLDGSGIKHPKLKINHQSILKWALNYYDAAENTSESKPWNGRQIRNAFQIASSLARYDSARDTLEKGKMPCPTLGARHFDLVARAIEKFDTYMEHATGGADSDHARIEGTRADEVRFSEDNPSKSSSSAAGNRMKAAQVEIPRSHKAKSQERGGIKSGAIPIRNNAAFGKRAMQKRGLSSSRGRSDEDEEMDTKYMSDGNYDNDDYEDYGYDEHYRN